MKKKLYSLSEMQQMGYPRSYCYQIVHHKLAPRYTKTTPGRGKYLIDIEEFEKVRHLIR